MSRRGFSRGFSLAETLVAIGVLAALVGSVFGFIGGLAARRDALERMTSDAAAAESLFTHLEADILTSLAGGGAMGAGIEGESQRLKLVTRSGLIDPEADGAIDLVRAEYRFDEGRGAAGGSVTISRRGARGEGGGSEVVSRRVQLLRFRYLTDGQWQERFSSAEAGGLPVAIEVAVWFVQGSGIRGQESGEAERFEDEFDDAVGALGGAPVGAPDRVRMFVVPDGPQAGWGAGS